MDLYLLDDFAARSVGITMAELTRDQRMPARHGAARRPRPRGRARLTAAVAGGALALPSAVVVVSQVLR